MHATLDRFRSFRWLLATLVLACPALSFSQSQAEQIDPPGRVAYVSLLEGGGTLISDNQSGTAPALLNTPVTSGTRISSEGGSRTELQAGFAAFRLSGKSNLEFVQLDDTDTRVALTAGTLSTRVRDLESGERFEIDTPNMALIANQAGEYRFDVDPRTDTTRLSVHSGSATVYGEGGQAVQVSPREQIVFAGRALQIVSRASIPYRDTFDQWVSSRDALDDRSISTRYVSPSIPGTQQLDHYGDWAQDGTYGAVWYPRVTVADWAPYRYGRWTWVDPWGWTWVDDAPWGFAPFHYGRWTQIGPRWAWVPGPRTRRPVYAPALVGFAGGTSGSASWNVSMGTAWFPLAPGEYWEPQYRSSQRYRHALNPWEQGRHPGRDGGYHFLRQPNAITASPNHQMGLFDGRRPQYVSGSRLPPREWSDARVIPPPARPGHRAPPPAAYIPDRDASAWRGPSRQDPARPFPPHRNDRTESDMQRQIDLQREQQARMDRQRQEALQRQEAQQRQEAMQQQQRQQWQHRQDQQRPAWERPQNPPPMPDLQRQRREQQREQQIPLWERQHGPLSGQQPERVMPPQRPSGPPPGAANPHREDRGPEQRRPAPRRHEDFN